MKLLALAASVFAVAAPSKTVQLAIIHAVHGCHVWQSSQALSAKGVLTITAGTKVVIDLGFGTGLYVQLVSGSATFFVGYV